VEFIDTHAHIYLEHFDKDINDILQRAKTSMISSIYLPNIDSSSIKAMLKLEDYHPDQCRAMIGLHPCSVKEDFEKELNIMESWLGQRKFAGIGETGTDLYWDKTYQHQQVDALKVQISWARDYNLPIILHSRDSLDLSIQVVESRYFSGISGIFHCFTGNLDQAKRIIDLGFHLGVGGVVTFKNSGLDGLLENIPLDSIVLETDSPYLAPVPFRGKRNEPSYIPIIANKLAEIYTIRVEEIAKITTENARKIFKEKEPEI
jgi:TatD DNase family protein